MTEDAANRRLKKTDFILKLLDWMEVVLKSFKVVLSQLRRNSDLIFKGTHPRQVRVEFTALLALVDSTAEDSGDAISSSTKSEIARTNCEITRLSNEQQEPLCCFSSPCTSPMMGEET